MRYTIHAETSGFCEKLVDIGFALRYKEVTLIDCSCGSGKGTQMIDDNRKTSAYSVTERNLDMLAKFVAQRSGIDYRDYYDRSSFMSDYRVILRQGRDFRALSRALAWRRDTTQEQWSAACGSGRLQIVPDGKKLRLAYATCQYFPTEYRAAACRVVGQLLWNLAREAHPDDDGAALRARFKREFGRGIAARWFD